MLDKHLFSSFILSGLNILHPHINTQLSTKNAIVMDYFF